MNEKPSRFFLAYLILERLMMEADDEEEHSLFSSVLTDDQGPLEKLWDKLSEHEAHMLQARQGKEIDELNPTKVWFSAESQEWWARAALPLITEITQIERLLGALPHEVAKRCAGTTTEEVAKNVVTQAIMIVNQHVIDRERARRRAPVADEADEEPLHVDIPAPTTRITAKAGAGSFKLTERFPTDELAEMLKLRRERDPDAPGAIAAPSAESETLTMATIAQLEHAAKASLESMAAWAADREEVYKEFWNRVWAPMPSPNPKAWSSLMIAAWGRDIAVFIPKARHAARLELYAEVIASLEDEAKRLEEPKAQHGDPEVQAFYEKIAERNRRIATEYRQMAFVFRMKRETEASGLDDKEKAK